MITCVLVGKLNENKIQIDSWILFEKKGPLTSSNLFQPKILFAKQQSSFLRSCEMFEKKACVHPGKTVKLNAGWPRKVDGWRTHYTFLICFLLFSRAFWFEGRLSFQAPKKGVKRALAVR